MAARTLEELQKQYNSVAKDARRGPGPGRRGPHRGGGGKPKNVKHTVKRLLSYIAAYKGRLVLVLFCMLMSTASSLVGGYILRPIINALASGEEVTWFAGMPFAITFGSPVEYLATVLFVIACVYAVGIVANYLQARIMLSVSLSATEKLRNDLFEKVQTLPVRDFDNDSNGEIMSRFTNDVDNIDMMLNNTVVSLISGTITLVGTFCMMVYTNIWLTLLTILFVPLYIRLGGAIGKRSGKYYAGQQAALGAINGYIEESVSGQKVVKVFNHEETCCEEFSLLNADMREKQFRAQFYGGIMGPIMGNTGQISYAITAGVGGVLCVLGGFDVGGLSIFVN